MFHVFVVLLIFVFFDTIEALNHIELLNDIERFFIFMF